ncbi:MAG: ABC transporter substrate-binding protein [Burkholderiaceae bacterium]|nr:ABC transporter substrate-binding protein [Burkholderiaceae bacterium]
MQRGRLRLWAVPALVLLATRAQASPLRVVLATAGPGNLSHLPVELVKKIGADRAEGMELVVRYFGGGPLAYKDMMERNSDFAVAGAPALAALAAPGEPVVSIAAVNRVPTFVLMVRSDLRASVRTAADLRGRVVGVNSSTVAVKSTSQQLAEFVLRRAGVEPQREVNFVPAGQTLAEQRAALESGAIDALMGDEPFASALRSEGRVFFLHDFHDPAVTRSSLGGLFLNAQLATRRDVLEREPEKAQRMVRALRRALQFLASHSAEEIAARMHPDDTRARQALATTLARHKGIYSPDAAFRREEIATAEAFFRANQPPGSPGARFEFARMIDARFVGFRED